MSSSATVLVTGAAGYIGSHIWVSLAQLGYRVIGLDNFCNSKPAVVDRIGRITGIEPVFYQGDCRDQDLLRTVFTAHPPAAVIHCAALKAVGESVDKPLAYYDNNLNSLLSLLTVMAQADCDRFIFSSSATVYGNPQSLPIYEDAPLHATNPYGQTKLISEQILRDQERARPGFKVAYLRYFNPVGAHESGLIGEDPQDTPNNLMPYVSQTAVGLRECLNVYGNDWPTPDGTCVRDYIHVVDLAQGHAAAADHLLRKGESFTVNLGTGRGTSVLEVISAFEEASGQKIPYRFAPRRDGDIAACYADVSKARELLGWQARHDIRRMCADAWRWQSLNPQGYAS